jgi:hypothetical protein
MVSLTLFLKYLHLQHAPIRFTAFIAAVAKLSNGPWRPDNTEAWLPELTDLESNTNSWYPELARL